MIANADDVIRFELSLHDGDDFVLGETVPASVRRLSDGKFLKPDDAWQSAYITRNLTELTGNDGVKGRYFVDLAAQPSDDVYMFRAFFTFAGEAKARVWEIQVDAESFATHDAAAVVTAMMAEATDGVSLTDILTAGMAVLLGVAVPSGDDVLFKERDGATTKVTQTYGTDDGERTGSVIA